MPLIGDQFILRSDWTFSLFTEYRNETLFLAKGLFGPKTSRYWGIHSNIPRDHPIRETGCMDMTLPAGTILQIDRIYIRKGAEDFDSLTMYIVDSPEAVLKPWKKIKPGSKSTANGTVRFWAKLPEMNGKMMVEWFDEPQPFGYLKDNAKAQEIVSDGTDEEWDV